MTFLFAILKLFPFGDILRAALENREAIGALIEFIEMHQDDKLRAESMDLITRGLRYAKQTGDTSQLEMAIRDHCTSSGCRIL